MTDTIPPSRVWDFFHAYKKDFIENMRLIASSSDGMLGIYLTEKGGDPFFVVEDCDDPIDEEIATSKKDCEETVKKLYAKYLDDDDNFFESEAIDEREDELSVLFENLIMDIVDKGYSEDGKEVVFVIGISSNPKGSINSVGAEFGSETHDGTGRATITFDLPKYDGDVKEAVAEYVGVSILNINKLEAQLPDVIKEIVAEKANIISNINVQ